MAESILSVEGVSKKFCRDLKRSLVYGMRDIVSEGLGINRGSDRLRNREFWAVKNVSLELKRGEALGLVGPNGSGKTTLLKMISGLFKPDIGTIRVRGRVAPLLALGAGFNPMLTGRENIYVNMSILGLRKREIEQRFESVVDFSELGETIDAPLQTYSSGMQARLGFSCAIHTDPDLLLVDEVLSVGDMRFRAKCYRKLAELRGKGTSFVLVSHNPNAILSACNRAVYLLKGDLVTAGPAEAVMSRYESDLLGAELWVPNSRSLERRTDEQTSTQLQILDIGFEDVVGQRIDCPTTGQPGALVVRCRATAPLEGVFLGLMVREMESAGEWILNLSGERDESLVTLRAGEANLRMKVPYWGLRPGSYIAKVYISQPRLNLLDAVESFKFRVSGTSSMSQNMFYQPRIWKVLQ